MANWRDSASKILENRADKKETPNVSAKDTSAPTTKSASKSTTPTTGTTSSGSWRDSAKKILENRGYVPPEKLSYELQLNDGKSFGVISYDAYKAIENNKLDKYLPKNQEEKKVIDTFKAYIESQAKEENATTSNLPKEKQAYIKYAVNKESDIEGVNNEQKLLGGDTAQWVSAPKKSGWDKFVEGAKEFFLPDGSNAKKIYDEVTDFKDDETGWSDDQLAKLAINALHRAESGDTSDFAIVDRAYARLSRSTKYKDSDLVLALKEAKKSWGASPWTAAGVNIKAAVAGTGADISSFANSLGADNVPGLKDITKASIEYGEKARQDAAEYNKGSYGEYLGGVTQGVVNLVPYYFLGSGKAATTALTKGSKYASYIKAVANNPSFWYSLTTMWGKKYQEALNGGATETEALKNAALYAIPAALVEVASGIGSEKMARQKLSETIIEEIGEEIAQDIIGGVSDKLTTKPNLPLLSMTEDAVINPVDLVKTAVTTAPIVAIGQGANVAINSAINRHNQKKELRKLTKDKAVVDAIVSFVTSTEPTVAEENSTTETPTVEQTTPATTKQANTVSKEIDDVSTTETSTVSVGEIFAEKGTDKTIKVVDRNDTATTVEITTNGKAETKRVPNKTADRLAIEDRYNKIEVSSESAETTNHTPIAENVTTKKTINLKRWGDNYEVYGNEAVALANALETETETTVVNGVETDVLRLPADKMLKASKEMEDDFNFVFSDKPIVETISSTTAENTPVANEKATSNETTPSTEENVPNDKISVVVDAINDTLAPGAKEGILTGMQNKGKDGGLVAFAEALVGMYEKSGSLNGLEKSFTDGGARVVSAMGGKTEAVERTESAPRSEELKSLYEQRDELKNLMEEMQKQGVEQSEIDKTKELVDEIESEISRLEQGNSESKVLKNQSESDTMEEKAKDETSENQNSVDRKEDNNEPIRGSVLPKNSRRASNESTQKQTGRISEFKQRNKGKNVKERKRIARELIQKGRVEKVKNKNHEYTLIKPEAYTDDMLSIVEEAKANGKEVGFFVGPATINPGTVDEFYADGIKISSTKMLLQYDGVDSPQLMYKHEHIHTDWNTSEVQEISATLDESLSAEEKQTIFEQERYAYYKRIYKGDMDAVWQEFVCDVMSGMNDYTENYIDVVHDYWYGDKSDKGYSPADYATSTDAGGERYSVYSYPRLNNSEWALLNRRLKIEIGNEDNFIDEYTKWLYASKNGTRVFAIYGIGWGEDATPLLAVGGSRADSYKRGIERYLEGKNNGSDRSRTSIDRRIRSLLANRGKPSDNLSADGNGRAKVENGTVYSEQRESNGKGVVSGGAENSNEVNHSLKDSTGRKLSKGQIEYFKDSKARDNDGNLMLVFHGSPEFFTIFDTHKDTSSIIYDASFFTSDETRAKAYADKNNTTGQVYKGYVDIKNPLMPSKAREQITLVPDSVKEKYQNEFDVDELLSKTDYIIVDFAKFVARKENSTMATVLKQWGFDGYINGTDYAIFEPEQFKSFDNTNPTSNPDYRYSISKEQDTAYMKAVENGDMETAQRMVDEAAKGARYSVKAYHGTARADRVGTVFRPDRATSGPMAYFTDSEEIASNYARNKADTSLAYDEEYDSYYTQFRVNRGGKSISVPELWKYLSIGQKNKIKEIAGQIKFDDDYENIIVDKSAKHGNGAYDAYTLNMHKGNVLEALVDTWLDTGDLYRREADFLEVLRLVGIEDAEYRNPDARQEKVYDTWLKIQKPFDTEFADKSFYESLSNWIESHDMSAYEKETSNADMWDKNNQTPESWLQKLNDDIENGTTHAWTVIPDFVTDYLKEQKFDGIKDKGGKGGGEGHTVWIPFSSEQVKSAEPVTYDDDGNVISLSERFNKDKVDFRYSVAKDSYAPTFYSHMGKTIDEMKQDKIGANSVVSYLTGRGVKAEEIKWSGIETFLDGKKSVTKAELQEFVANNQLQIEENIATESPTIDYTEQERDALETIEQDLTASWTEAEELWEDRFGEKMPLDIRFNDNDVSMVRRELIKRAGDNFDGLCEGIEKCIDNIERSESRRDHIVSQAKKRMKRNGLETRWGQYKLGGGENYREITFKMPNSDYSNSAMTTHWGDNAEGILAHARIQDFDVDGKKMLFIEEIQSDWHNEGHRRGYRQKGQKTEEDIRRADNDAYEEFWESHVIQRICQKLKEAGYESESAVVANLWEGKTTSTYAFLERLGITLTNDEKGYIEEQAYQSKERNEELKNAVSKYAPPDAPYRDNYHEYVLKHLIRMAAEQGYDSIGWTTADIQSDRWSDDYAEGYRIEYDQDIPKFLNKYGKKWGAKVGQTSLGGTMVWSMPITDAMKESVLYEGQPRYSISKEENPLETQKKIEGIAKDIGSHDELIEYAKKNTKEFVAKIKENKSLQKRLQNAKRQTLLSPKPAVNVAKVGKITKDILVEMESTLKASELREEAMSIYNEYFAEIKKAKGVESKVQEANDNMMDRFAKLAVDIVDSSVAYTESEEHELLKSYVKNTRINIPEDAKSEAHYAEFRKSHMGTFNLTNDGLPIDRAYQELCDMFPGLFSTEVTAPADQLYAIAEALESTEPYAYNPHKSYMQDAIDHVVFRFASEVDGLAVMPKTKAQKIAEKGAYDKNMALDKERTEFERKLGKHKEQSEKVIRKLQKKIDDADYVRYWEKRLGKEEKADAIKQVRDKRDVAILKSKIRNIVSDMKKKLDKTEKNGGYPKELVKAAAEICSVLDFHTDRTGKNGAPTNASLKLDALKMQYDALKNNPNYDLASEYNEELSDKILSLNDAISDKRVVDLSKSELEKLKDILSEINTRLSEASKQIGQANARANIEIATDIINSLKLDNKAISEVRNQLLKEMRLAKEAGKAFVVNPHRIFEMIANYDRDSAWWQLYDQILRGSRNAAKFTMDASMPFDEITDGGGNEIAFYDFRTKLHKTGIKYQDGTEVELPKSIICELVMLWDRKKGRDHLEVGGVKIPDLNLFNKGKTADALASGKMTNAITQADITRLKGMLDSYDKAWIERSRHLFNKVAKDAINETSMQLLGREVAKADNYIRIYVDSDFVRKDIGKEDGEITIEGHGSLKETDPDAKNPLVLRGLHENVYEHIDFAAKYYGLAIPIRNFNKVYKISINDKGNFDSVKNALGSVFGPKIRDGVVVQAIKDLQSPRHRELSFFNKIRGGWLNATFWANIRSMLKQTTSYWTASSILGEDSLAKGLVSYAAHRKQTKLEIAKYSGTLYKRAQGLSTTELGDRANRKRLAGLSSKTTKFINNNLPALRQIPEWIRPGNWLQSMDCAVASALWDACKFEVSKTMNSSDDGYMKAVTDLYERVIEETQSNYDVLHRPEILKSTNMAYQTLGMFQTDNLQQTGIMYGALGDLKAKSKAYKADKSSVNEQKLKDAKKRMGKAVRSRVYSSVWLVAVSMLGDALLRKFKLYVDDEEKEITSGSVLKQTMLNMSEDMLSVFVPVVGQLATKAMDTFGKGYDFLNDPAFDVLEDFIKATSKIYYAYDEDGDVSKAWIDAIPAMSNMFGVPAKNISDLYNGIKGYIGDITVGDFAHDLTDYSSGGKSFYNYGDLASYIVSGDKEKEKKLLDYYSENGKEIAKGSLTQEIKPAYVQMYIDSPKEAYNLKRKLILEYDYSEETIGNWTIAEYFKHAIPGKKYDDDVVSNPEYASEIASAVQGEKNWRDSYYSTIRSKYKTIYKKGEEADTEALKKALIQDFKIPANDIRTWESEADKALKKSAEEREAEKKRFK